DLAPNRDPRTAGPRSGRGARARPPSRHLWHRPGRLPWQNAVFLLPTDPRSRTRGRSHRRRGGLYAFEGRGSLRRGTLSQLPTVLFLQAWFHQLLRAPQDTWSDVRWRPDRTHPPP